jgi:hypothetical protein
MICCAVFLKVVVVQGSLRFLIVLIGFLSFWMEVAKAADRPAPLVIASGEVSGYYFPAAGALCRVMNKDKIQGRTCLVQPTIGSSANLAEVGTGEVELGLAQSRAAFLAGGSGEGYQGTPVRDLRAVMSLYGEAVLVLVRPESQINQISDLKGKRVNLGKVGSFQRSMATSLLSAAKLSEGDFAQVVELDLDAQAQSLCDGNLDAAFFSGVHPMTEVMGAIDQCGAVPLSIPLPIIAQGEAKMPWISKMVIPGNSYEGIKDDVTTLAVRTLLVTTERAPSEFVYEIVKAIHGNFAALVRLHPVLSNLSRVESSKAGIAIPLHDGARRFYTEQGYLK